MTGQGEPTFTRFLNELAYPGTMTSRAVRHKFTTGHDLSVTGEMARAKLAHKRPR